jgi:hypothetical protein
MRYKKCGENKCPVKALPDHCTARISLPLNGAEITNGSEMQKSLKDQFLQQIDDTFKHKETMRALFKRY